MTEVSIFKTPCHCPDMQPSLLAERIVTDVSIIKVVVAVLTDVYHYWAESNVTEVSMFKHIAMMLTGVYHFC